jgi:hypothetical protein
LPTQGLPRSSCWRLALPFVLMFGTVVAQPVPSQPAAAPESSAPPEAASKVGLKKFQERIDAAALALRDSNPQFKNLSPKYLQGIAEFVSGNMLFVLLRELGLASIIQMGLPVVGRIEDAADSFAALRLIRVGDDFSHRVLTEAAKGWFLADRRDQKTGTKVAYYDEHGLNQQRAYQIVCLMVGSDDEKFNDLAKETKLPEARRDTCAGDYKQRRLFMGFGAQAASAFPRPAENGDRNALWPGRRQGQDRPASGSRHPAAANGGRARGQRLRLAEARLIGNAKLRLPQRPMGSCDQQAYAVLRTRRRICRPLSRLWQRGSGRTNSGQLEAKEVQRNGS